MPKCKKCSAPMKWKQPYKKGDRPVNLDGSPHSCERPDKNFIPEYIKPDRPNLSYCGKCKTLLINCGCDFCSVYQESWCTICTIHPNRTLGISSMSWEGEVIDMTHPTIENIKAIKEKTNQWNSTYLNKQ